jgi:hypothetical protein
MTNAYLEITMTIDDVDRPKAAVVYNRFKAPFLDRIKGATSKELLIRTEDVQVLHGFNSLDDAQKYLSSKLFNDDVVVALKPLLKSNPEIRLYTKA